MMAFISDSGIEVNLSSNCLNISSILKHFVAELPDTLHILQSTLVKVLVIEDKFALVEITKICTVFAPNIADVLLYSISSQYPEESIPFTPKCIGVFFHESV